MEDKHIFKGEMVYSVRIDVKKFTKKIEKIVSGKLKEYFTRAVVARENKKDGTCHFQACAWRNQKLPSKDNSTIRTYFKQLFNYDYSNAVSLVSARKVESLAKYCNNKEKKGVISWGISDLSILGQWQNATSQQEKYKDLLIKKLESENKFEEICIRKLCVYACEIYKDCRPPPFKSLLQLGRSSGYIPQKLFIEYYYKDLQFYNVEFHLRSDYTPQDNSCDDQENTIISYMSYQNDTPYEIESDSEA